MRKGTSFWDILEESVYFITKKRRKFFDLLILPRNLMLSMFWRHSSQFDLETFSHLGSRTLAHPFPRNKKKLPASLLIYCFDQKYTHIKFWQKRKSHLSGCSFLFVLLKIRICCSKGITVYSDWIFFFCHCDLAALL